jgi:hypothetical protein
MCCSSGCRTQAADDGVRGRGRGRIGSAPVISYKYARILTFPLTPLQKNTATGVIHGEKYLYEIIVAKDR